MKIRGVVEGPNLRIGQVKALQRSGKHSDVLVTLEKQRAAESNHLLGERAEIWRESVDINRLLKAARHAGGKIRVA